MTDPRPERIADKTKPYTRHSLIRKVVSITLEIFCYLLIIGFVVAAVYLPGYLELKLDEIEEQIGFYTLDPEDHPFWIFVLRAALITLSLFPLTIVVLLRLVRRRRKILAEVYNVAKQI